MTENHHETVAKAHRAPDPEDPAKPDTPDDIEKSSWKYVFKRAFSEFSKDQCTDLAAALTYFAVLSMFPGLLAVVSLLGVFGQGEATTRTITDLLKDHAPQDVVSLLEGPISQLTNSSGAGIALLTGILGALWTASGYVGAFGRAMNRIYEVGEGRPVWKLRPIILLVTLIMTIIVVLMMLILAVSGGIAQSIGDAIGLGDTAVTVWNILKWPLLLALAVVLIAILYYATPNVRQPKLRWISIGSILALVAMAIAGAAFAFYVTNFSKYNATYGAIGSVIILLLGLWIMNNVLLFGAEVDAETERGRQLQGGIEAEETIQLPPRDTKQIDKKQQKEEKLVAEARDLRLEHERNGESSAKDSAEGDSAQSRPGSDRR